MLAALVDRHDVGIRCTALGPVSRTGSAWESGLPRSPARSRRLAFLKSYTLKCAHPSGGAGAAAGAAAAERGAGGVGGRCGPPAAALCGAGGPHRGRQAAGELFCTKFARCSCMHTSPVAVHLLVSHGCLSIRLACAHRPPFRNRGFASARTVQFACAFLSICLISHRCGGGRRDTRRTRATARRWTCCWRCRRWLIGSCCSGCRRATPGTRNATDGEPTACTLPR